MKYEIRAKQVDVLEYENDDPYAVYELSVLEYSTGKTVRQLKVIGDAELDNALEVLVNSYV
jgi:hypothetical protein